MTRPTGLRKFQYVNGHYRRPRLECERIWLASEHEPQKIALRGELAVVVIPREDCDRLVQPQESLVDVMQRSPLYYAEDVEFKRDQSLAQAVEL